MRVEVARLSSTSTLKPRSSNTSAVWLAHHTVSQHSAPHATLHSIAAYTAPLHSTALQPADSLPPARVDESEGKGEGEGEGDGGDLPM